MKKTPFNPMLRQFIVAGCLLSGINYTFAMSCTGGPMSVASTVANGKTYIISMGTTAVPISINLLNYSTYINAALAGQPLGSNYTPFCAASLKTTSTPPDWSFNNLGPVYDHAIITLNDNQNVLKTLTNSATGKSGVLVANATTGASSSVIFTYTVCPCYSTPDGYCSESNFNITPNQPTTIIMNGDMQYRYNPNQIGTCYDTITSAAATLVGSIVTTVYAPPGVIPAVGTYTTTFTLNMTP